MRIFMVDHISRKGNAVAFVSRTKESDARSAGSLRPRIAPGIRIALRPMGTPLFNRYFNRIIHLPYIERIAFREKIMDDVRMIKRIGFFLLVREIMVAPINIVDARRPALGGVAGQFLIAVYDARKRPGRLGRYAYCGIRGRCSGIGARIISDRFHCSRDHHLVCEKPAFFFL